MAEPEIAQITTASAAIDGNFVKMTHLLFSVYHYGNRSRIKTVISNSYPGWQMNACG